MIQFQFKLFLIILLLATLGDLLIPIIIGTKYPGYSHFIDTISSLGTNEIPVQRYQCFTLVVVGLLFILFTIGQYKAFASITWCHKIYIIGIILYGIGTIIAGILPEDPVGIDETVSDITKIAKVNIASIKITTSK